MMDPPRGRKILFTTIGSLGDLHPYLAIGLGLKARGHEVGVATGECYRRKVESLGLEFHPIRPDSTFVTDPLLMRRFMDYRWGTIRVLRELIVPAIRQTYDDVLAAVDGGVDLLVSHPLTFATGLVAEKKSIAWASTQITPLGLASAYDPPVLPIFPDLSIPLRRLGPWFWRPLKASLRVATNVWGWPIQRLRAEVGLPAFPGNPLVDADSPALVLALFSRILADTQPDWPRQVIHTGFPIHDRGDQDALPEELVRFLDAGPPPIVFTLGDSAASVAGSFFEISALAAKKLGRRAVLILGRGSQVRSDGWPEGVVAFDYAPFSLLFPRAAVIVHAGGIGSTGLAMRARRPMLVVPLAHDQPENAARLVRMGVARSIPHHRFTEARATTNLDILLNDQAYARSASRMPQEDGVGQACDALERLLAH